MPIYDFQCPRCCIVERDVWSDVSSIHDRVCPNCSELMEVMLHATPVLYGNSFYNKGEVKQLEITVEKADGTKVVHKNLQHKMKSRS